MSVNPHVQLSLSCVFIAQSPIYTRTFDKLFEQGTMFGQDSTGQWFISTHGIVRAYWAAVVAGEQPKPTAPCLSHRDYWRSINAADNSLYMQTIKEGITQIL